MAKNTSKTPPSHKIVDASTKSHHSPSKSQLSLHFLHLYPNMMDLYGDSGNLQILKFRAESRGIKISIDSYQIGDPTPDFSQYDLIFLGGGSDKEQKVVARDILNHQAALAAAHQAAIFFLLICGGFQLFGQYYKDATGGRIPGLKFYDYYTESSTDKRQRCIGNIVISANFGGHRHRIIGFENHGGQTRGVTHPFGEVLTGNGNTFASSEEGLFEQNFLGTYLHGPLLSKNPALSDYILSYCLERKYGERIVLSPLDDSFERHARRELLEKLL